MRIHCPHCGLRDSREFTYRGAAVGAERPEPEASADIWDDFVHLRANPAGPTRELWYHEFGCAAWVVVTRDTTTHEVLDHWPATHAKEAAR